MKPFRVSLVGKGRLGRECDDAAKQRNECLGKNDSREEGIGPDHDLGTQGIKTSSNFGLVFVLQIRFKALRVRAIKLTLVID